MSKSNNFSVPHDIVVQRALDFYELSETRRAKFLAADKDLVSEWWQTFKDEADAALRLPTYDQLRSATSQVTLDRNIAIKASRPLLQDLYYYARKAYPSAEYPGNYFSQNLYTQGSSNPLGLNKALQAAVAALATRRADVEEAGMPAAKIDQLIDLAALAQKNTTGQHVSQGNVGVETGENTSAFAALWEKCGLVAEAALVAFRDDDDQRRLFLLYPGGPEERSLTVPAGTEALPGLRSLVLNSALSADRRLSLTVAAPGGPVRVLLLAPNASFDKADGTEEATTKYNKPARCTAAELGWKLAGDQQLVVINPTDQKAVVKLRVLPVGE